MSTKNTPPARPDPVLAEHAAAIRKLGRQTVENVVEIGRLLTECKRICGHGKWLPWLEREFGWEETTAQRFMRVHELALSKSGNLPDLPVSAIYLLAAPSTPKEGAAKVIEHAEAGKPMSVAEVKQIVEQAKGRKQPSSKPRKAQPAKVAAPPPQPSNEAPQPTAGQPPRPEPPPRDDIGPDSQSEAARLRVYVEKLEAEKHCLEFKILGLEREVEELREKLATATGTISEFQTASKKWEDTDATHRGIIVRLQNENAVLRAQVDAPPADPRDPGPMPPSLVRRAAS